MAARLRFKVVDEAFMRAPVYVEQPKERPSEYFGKYGQPHGSGLSIRNVSFSLL